MLNLFTSLLGPEIQIFFRHNTAVEGHFNPGLFNPKCQPQTFQPQAFQPWTFQPRLLNPGLSNPKSGIEKSGVGKFMVEKFGFEAWGRKVPGWNVLQPCKRLYFCQNSCLESAWKTYHKEECKCLRKIDFKSKIPQDIVRLMARIIFKLRKGEAHWHFWSESLQRCQKYRGSLPNVGLYQTSRPVWKSGKFLKSGLSENRTFALPDTGLLTILKIEEALLKKFEKKNWKLVKGVRTRGYMVTKFLVGKNFLNYAYLEIWPSTLFSLHPLHSYVLREHAHLLDTWEYLFQFLSSYVIFNLGGQIIRNLDLM